MSEKEKSFEENYVKYNLALRKLDTEVRNYVDSYNYNHDCNIVKEYKSRIKKFESASNKMKSRGIEVTPENMNTELFDMVGYRIVCRYKDDVYKLVDLIKTSNSLRILDETDYIQNPKESGYRSYHIDVAVPVKFNGERIFVNAEIQIRTKFMDTWAEIDHELKYKHSPDIQEKLHPEFLALANAMNRWDDRIMIIRDEGNDLDYEESLEKPKKMVRKR